MSQTKAQLVGGVGFSTADSLTVHNGLAVTGVVTATSFAGNISGDATGLTGSPNIDVTNITASGNVTIGGTLTYEDVTNIDAIGIVTARSGINITGAGMTVTGISTFRGDVQVADKIVHLDDSNTAIRFPAADTFSVETAGSERLLVDSSGNVDIGNNNGSSSNTGWYIQPDGTAYVFTNGSTDAVKIFAGSSDERITLKGDGELVISDKITHMGDTNTNIRFPAADTFTVETAGSEALRIDSSRRLLVGTTSAPAGTDAQYSKLAVRGNTLNSNACYLSLGNNKSTTNTTSDDNLGIITFNDNDSDAGEYARITGASDGANATNDYPGKLIFATTADGASSPTERMRIKSDGTLHAIKSGTQITNAEQTVAVFQRSSASGSTSKISIVSGNGASSHINFGDTDDEDVGQLVYDHSNNSMQFLTNTSERMRILSNGHVVIGDTTDTGFFRVTAADGASDDQYVGQFENLETYYWQRATVSTFVQVQTALITVLGLKIGANDTTQFLIRGDGNVGIGTAVPGSELHLAAGDTNCAFKITNTSGGSGGLIQQNGSDFNFNNLDSGNMRFYTADTERMRLDSSGRMGLGTNSPSQILELKSC